MLIPHLTNFSHAPLLKPRNPSKKVQLKITFPSKIVKFYQVFARDLEQAINHALVVWFIIKDKQIKANIQATKNQLAEKEESHGHLIALQAQVSNTKPSIYSHMTEGQQDISLNIQKRLPWQIKRQG